MSSYSEILKPLIRFKMNFIFLSGSDCPVLGTPISGRKYGSKYNNGDIVTFECDPGFVLKGSALRKCSENGAWNGTEAICRGKCLEIIHYE